MIATFPFAIDPSLSTIGRLFGVVSARTDAQVDDEMLTVHFGIWSMRVPLVNIAETTVTGPYKRWRVAGGPRLSLADRGLTFATTTSRGLCIRFVEPMPAPWPGGLPTITALTVTVADPEALAEMLALAPT
ncbi:MAG: hypothetical protein WD023_09765 [Ilumatobacteraceae bacterium]